MMVSLIALPFLGLSTIMSAVLTAADRPVAGQVVNTLLFPLFMCVGLTLLYYFYGSILTSFEVALLLLGVGVACGLISVLQVIQEVEISLPRLTWRGTIGWSHSAAWLSIASAMAVFQSNLDVIIVDYILGSEAAGVYRLAARLAFVGSIASVAVQPIATSVLVKYLSGTIDADEASQRIGLLAAFTSIISLVAAVIVVISAVYIMPYIGRDYTGGMTVVIIIATGYIFYSLAGPGGVAMRVLSYDSLFTWIVLLMLLASFLSYPVAAFYLGINGVAASTVLCAIGAGWVFSCVISRRERINLSVFSRAIVKALARKMV
ncbi:hypothetical protein MAE02_34570 [Microvirga aerophila]|uniref:Polysaccharide biosynthesis protein C-terminal domain-containing protein n=2 Tax=Microvirga aerophila TaxID=670291 RepID=A0A512BUV8_9HYPH|nr:hypothetical protein MAE02_34570 [Microvirga aerophila]